MKYLLGLDVGTTGTKAMLFSEDGALVGRAYRAYPLSTPQIGRSEQDARDWWRAAVETIRELCAAPEIGKNVAALSLSAQGGTTVPVDEYGEPTRPAIVWSDKRCAAQREAYLAEVGPAETLYETTGWKLGVSLNLSQIRWMRDNEPENFAKTRYFLSVEDYLSYRMTGIPACDLSDAGINHLADIRAARYDETLLRFAGITEARLPKLVRSGEAVGTLTPSVAAELGLSTDCVFAAGAHDQYAVALGGGACRAGDILVGTGTAWVVTAIGDAPDFASGLAQSVAATPGKWGTMWSLGSGGVCLDWWRGKLALGVGGEPMPYEALNAEAPKRSAAEQGLFFYPFTGRATLQKNFPKATFLGLDLSHDRFDLARAIMEGVSFQIVRMLGRFRTKPSPEGLKLAGGATKSPLWCQLTADIAGLPVRIPEVPDLACVGAAILAGVGCGVFADTEEGYRRLAVAERVVQPDVKNAEKYRALFAEYVARAEKLAAVYGL